MTHANDDWRRLNQKGCHIYPTKITRSSNDFPTKLYIHTRSPTNTPTESITGFKAYTRHMPTFDSNNTCSPGAFYPAKGASFSGLRVPVLFAGLGWGPFKVLFFGPSYPPSSPAQCHCSFMWVLCPSSLKRGLLPIEHTLVTRANNKFHGWNVDPNVWPTQTLVGTA